MSVDLVTIPYSRLDPGNEVARAYAVEPERVLPLFAHDYRDPRGLRPLLDAQGAYGRPALGAALAAYNEEVGGSVENARRLDGAACVISGQQVGLLLGPAYTTYKLFTLVNAARALESELGTPVVPVFWVESEDHDWDEVNRFFFKGRGLRVEADVPARTPVSRIDADRGPFLAEARELVGDGEAWDLVEPGGGVARAHVRSLARLVAGEGVVFVEPAVLREPMRPLAGRILEDAGAIDAALRADTGFAPALTPPDGAYLFDAGEGERERVPRGAALPARWSTDVVSRVLVQNAAFPALMAVCGPSEIRYWAQLRPVHEHFGIPMPAVLPRDAATLVEKGVARDAAKLGVDLEDVVRDIAVRPTLEEADPTAERLRRLAGEADELLAAAESGDLDLPGNTAQPFRRATRRLHGELEKLAARLEDARLEQAGAGKRRWERVQGELRPRGELQERVHSLFPYLVRHGPGLAASLRESFDPFEIGHYLVRL